MRRALQLAGGAALRSASARAALPSAARSLADAAGDAAPEAAPPADAAPKVVSAQALRRARIKARNELRPLGGGSVMRVRNVPRFALRAELAALITAAGAPVTPDQLRLSYDERLRPEHWFVQLPPSPPPAEVMSKLRGDQHQLGARKLVIDAVESVPPVPAELEGILGRACLVTWLAPWATANEVTAAFSGYRLARNHKGGPVSLLQLPPDSGRSGQHAAALVRFASALDAVTAARDLHRAMVAGARIEVRYVQ